MGGTRRTDVNEASNLVALCRPCHSRTHAEPNWATVNGRILQQHQDPTKVPVVLRHGTVLLTDAGEVERVEPDE
jgi:hypothetical protein